MAAGSKSGEWRRKTKLCLINDFQVRFGARGNRLEWRTGHRVASTGKKGLPVLEAFREPRTMVDALAHLKPRLANGQAWVDAAGCIERLYRAGFLIDAENAKLSIGSGESYGGLGPYVRLLKDGRRNDAMLAAVRAVVRAGDVVVDVGTGTGLMAIAAAQAGASRVYAIEPTGIGPVAEANFQANGYGDRITLITGMSMDIELPERADVLLTDLISNDPFGERVVQITADARRRLLKPTARLVPNRLSVYALPITVPDALLPRETLTSAHVETWRRRYGIDLGALRKNAPPLPSFITANPWQLSGRAIGTPVRVFDSQLAMATVDDLAIHVTGTFDATASAQLNGVLICFDMELAPGLWLSLHPDQVDQDNVWRRLLVWLLPAPIMLEQGSRYRLTYSQSEPGVPDGVQVRTDAGGTSAAINADSASAFRTRGS